MQHTARHTDIRTINDILKTQSHHMHDMVVPADRLRMNEEGKFVIEDAPIPDRLADRIGADAGETATLPYDGMKLFHSHLASKLPLPAFKRTYDHMRDDEPELAADVVNTYLQKDDRRFLVRTFRPEDEDGGRGLMRALLSDSYRVIQNRDVLLSAAKAVRDAGLEPDVRCSLTQGNMYAEFTLSNHPVDVSDIFGDYDPTKGEGCAPGFLIRNSEVGQGAFEIRPRVEVMVCSNGMTRKKDALRKIHAGSDLQVGSLEFSDKVRRKAMELAQQQVREAVEYFASEQYVREVAEDVFGDHVEQPVENPQAVMRNARSALGINEEEEDALLDHFYETEKRQVDVPQAVTEWAQEQPDADLQYEVEDTAWGLLDQMDQLDVDPHQEN